MKVLQFSKDFDRSNFSCEEESLTNYIQKQVSQDMKKNLSACFVILNDTKQVVAYYTLSSGSIPREDVPEKVQKKIPLNYPIPVILLGRLARDISQKGQGIGEFLLLDALFRCGRISESLGAMAVVLEPLNQYAMDFYKKYGFVLLPNSLKMFLPIKQIKTMMNSKKG